MSFRRYVQFGFGGVYGLKVNGLGEQVPNVFGGSALTTLAFTPV